MNIVIFGPQGSGKGTQSQLLVAKLKLFYFESGRFLRELAKENRDIDNLINKKGKVVPTGIMFEYVKKHLKKYNPSFDNILFDGYPRTIRQYHLLKDLLREKEKKVNYAVYLEISRKISIERLSGRRICEECGTVYNLVTNPPPKDGCKCGGKLIQRKDDKPMAIETRLNIFQEKTKPLVNEFRKENIMIKVDGERSIDEIQKEILTKLS